MIDPQPRGRYKRFSQPDLDRLETLQKGSPGENLLQTLNSLGAVHLSELANKAGIPIPLAFDLLGSPDLAEGFLVLKGEGNSLRVDPILIGRPTWTALSQKAAALLGEYHQAYPLRLGMPKEEFRRKLKLSSNEGQLFILRWQADGLIADHGKTISLASHQVELNSNQKKSAATLLQKFNDPQFSPPSVKECQQEVGEEVYAVLVSQGELVQINLEVVISSRVYEKWHQATIDLLKTNGKITVAEFRDTQQTSRKFALAFLEDLDAKGVTRREGDYRVLNRGD